MGDKTGIEWVRNADGSAGATWNFVRGCKEVSPGCDHCYARRFAERWRGIPGHPYEAGFDPRFVPHLLELPLRWRKPRTIFVNSQSDLFQGAFSNEIIAAGHGVMAACPQHIFQLLTKRGKRLRKWHAWIASRPSGLLSMEYSPKLACAGIAQKMLGEAGKPWHWSVSDARAWPLPNLWQGVSVESREYLTRVDDLRAIPAAVRFLSLEPLLEDLGVLDLTGIHWVIVGGESGPGARPMAAEWVRSVRDSCAAAGVPFFFKQWGGMLNKVRGRELDGRTHDAMPPLSRAA